MEKKAGKATERQKRKLSQKELFKAHPAYKNNLDTMKLLVTSKEFSRAVKEMRLFLDIPESGFIRGNSDVKEWTKRMNDRADAESLTKSLLNQIQRIRTKIRNDEESQQMAKKQIRLLEQKISWNYFTRTNKEILDQFNLPLNFLENIRRYVIFNEISAPYDNYSIGPWQEGTKSISDLPYLPITIYAKLTNKDLQQIKRETETSLARRLPKYDELKNIDELIELDEWNKHKERFNEGEQKEYRMTAREISENILKSKRHVQKVYDSDRRLKALKKKRFGTE